eukprot:TRINITY_DN19317_c0_g1_i1.p1 TRINITY_DN19317_c0_g1~~TRINITY_DN19317_c0_g1_i1.p1  ORF type:complete len:144 (-),score=45.15 TRINITY_DN19317_c0_g1_i1:199-630(-)
MSFKKRTITTNATSRKRKRYNNDDEEEDCEIVQELVQQTKLLQQGRARLKGSDMTPNREIKMAKQKNDESDFSGLKFGLNSFQPQVDLPTALQHKMNAYIEEKLKHLRKAKSFFDEPELSSKYHASSSCDHLEADQKEQQENA